MSNCHRKNRWSFLRLPNIDFETETYAPNSEPIVMANMFRVYYLNSNKTKTISVLLFAGSYTFFVCRTVHGGDVHCICRTKLILTRNRVYLKKKIKINNNKPTFGSLISVCSFRTDFVANYEPINRFKCSPINHLWTRARGSVQTVIKFTVRCRVKSDICALFRRLFCVRFLARSFLLPFCPGHWANNNKQKSCNDK